MNKNILFALGRPFAPIYSLMMRFREFLYQRNFFKAFRPQVPVISVGNLTMGGTGKTPLVQYLARMLQKKGLKPAIISRGYGGKAQERVNLVSDGKQILMEAELAGDEPRLLAESLPGVAVLTGVVRKLPAIRAIEDGADVLILDDGFQHLAVARDLDLVLFNSDSLAGNSRVFPGGDLREPVAALNRCHAFVLTSTCESNQKRAQQFAELLTNRFPDKPVFLSKFTPSALVKRSPSGEVSEMPLAPLDKVYTFCGIARPDGFTSTLKELQITPRGIQTFRDHYSYQQSDIDKLISKAAKLGAEGLITTEKDLVKLGSLNHDLPVYAVKMEVKPDHMLDNFIINQLTNLLCQ